ncbi:MAG: DNA polymerase/3'-5' exonuclease PolX [Gemmatimonadetes bacterium]|nr:DNA polymerase/3'-5' exonuclease PolX [Gemmatimonadota bacterium]
MENVDIARTLRETADLLEIQGANPFRIRAYRNAVRTIEALTRSLQDMVAAGDDLTELQGVGKEMDAHIRELLQTGQLSTLNAVTEVVPRTLAELTRLDGVGPKKAKRLYDELGVESVEGLEAEIQRGTVQELKGFGARSAEKMLRAIGDHRKQQGRFLRAEVEPYVESLQQWMESLDGVERLEWAGSWRRRRETIGDLDLLASYVGDGTPVVEHFTRFDGAVRVEAAGSTKGNIILRSGLSVDLRVIPPESFGAALHYFTGSKEHNVHIRTLGVKLGLRINEWGVFEVPADVDPETVGKDGGRRVGGETEDEVFAALDLAWIPPELREDRGEIDAAREGDLPTLLELSDIRGDLHMHSTWTDGTASILDMAEACAERGYGYMAITDHSQAVTMVGGLTPERVREQWDEVRAAQEEIGDRLRILRGQEVDILKDGSLDQPDDLLAELDVVVASVHSFMDLDRTQMTRRVVRAVSHGGVDILGHATGRLLGRREPYALDVEAVLEACAEHDVAVEINAHPRRLDLDDRHVARARELGVRVVINSDAHAIRGLDVMRFGVEQARRGWLESEHVLNTRPLADVLAWLEGRRKRG